MVVGFSVLSGVKLPTFLPREVEEICELRAIEALARMKRVRVKPPSWMETDGGGLGISYAEFGGKKGVDCPTIALLHGFDSSLLEFRRLAPLLTEHRVLTIDLHGWGFNERPKGMDFGVEAKTAVLSATLDQLVDVGEQVSLPPPEENLKDRNADRCPESERKKGTLSLVLAAAGAS